VSNIKAIWHVLTAFFRTVVGIRGKNGVVFGVEKLVQSKLYEHGANKRIFHIDRHIGMVSTFYKVIEIQ
jgi:20S proteasome alpha/beta subunit